MKIKNRIRSFSYAFKGIALMFHHQPNFYIHLSLSTIALGLSYFLDLSRSEFLWIVLAIGLVLSAEIFNTAIEKLTDMVQPNQDSKAGNVKDLAAAAVLVSAFTALAIGLIIFIPRLIEFFQ